MLDFWVEAASAWITYLLVIRSFPRCTAYLHQKRILAFFIVMEMLERLLQVKIRKANNNDNSKSKSNLRSFVTWAFALYMLLLALFLYNSGQNNCSYLYFTSSAGGMLKIMAYLIGFDAQNFTKAMVDARLARKTQSILTKINSTNATNNTAPPYWSETVDDLHREVDFLMRKNVNNLLTVFRLTISMTILVVVMSVHGIRFQITSLALKTGLQLLLNVMIFFSTAGDAMDSWMCYSTLTETEIIEKGFLIYQSNNKAGSKIHSTSSTASDSDEKDICTICLIPQNVESIKLKVCSHIFHEGCLLSLLRFAGHNNNKKKCPICREPIFKQEDADFFIPHI